MNLFSTYEVFCAASDIGDGEWRTINGQHIFIRTGETPKQAFDRTLSKETGKASKLYDGWTNGEGGVHSTEGQTLRKIAADHYGRAFNSKNEFVDDEEGLKKVSGKAAQSDVMQSKKEAGAFAKQYGLKYVYRGIGADQANELDEQFGAGKKGTLGVNSLSSWTHDPWQAGQFAKANQGAVIRMKVNPDDVWGVSGVTKGHSGDSEQEIIMGHPKPQMQVNPEDVSQNGKGWSNGFTDKNAGKIMEKGAASEVAQKESLAKQQATEGEAKDKATESKQMSGLAPDVAQAFKSVNIRYNSALGSFSNFQRTSGHATDFEFDIKKSGSWSGGVSRWGKSYKEVSGKDSASLINTIKRYK